MLLASLGLRARQRTLWFIRKMQTSRGPVYVYHYLHVWSALMVVFLVLLEVNIWKSTSLGPFH